MMTLEYKDMFYEDNGYTSPASTFFEEGMIGYRSDKYKDTFQSIVDELDNRDLSYFEYSIEDNYFILQYKGEPKTGIWYRFRYCYLFGMYETAEWQFVERDDID